MKTLVIAVILNFSLWQLAYTQEASDTVFFESIEVVATKIPDSYKTTQFDSSIINESTNLSQLLQKHSPIFIKTYGSGSLASVSFRGTGASHTNVLWNDISLNSPMNGQIDFSLYPTLFFDNAELHYGASGLIDGNGALGGSVNLSNTATYERGTNVRIQQSIGSFNNYITAAKFGYSSLNWFTETQIYYNTNKNNFEYVNVALQDQPVQIQNKAELQQYGFQQAIFKKLRTGNLGIRLWYFNSDRMLPPTMQITDNDENQKDESFRAMIEWTGLKGNFKYKLVNGFITDELIYTNTMANINSKSNSYSINNKLFTKYYLSQSSVLVNNISIRHEHAKADGYDNAYNRFNNSWLLGLTKNFKRLGFDAFNRFTVVGENVQLVSPSLGIHVGLLRKHQLRIKANGGINYNYPTFNDLYWSPGGNPELKPERAKMVELGSSYTHKNMKSSFTVEATAFYSYVYDWIIWQPTSAGFWSPQNLKEVENKGIEIRFVAQTNIKKMKLDFSLNYGNTYSTNLKGQSIYDNSVDKQLRYVPFHQLNYNIGLGFKSYRLSYNYNYTGRRFITSDNNWYLPANFISDLQLSKKFKTSNKSNFSTSLRINNLFDQDYQSIAWRPMPGRNYLFTLTFQFN